MAKMSDILVTHEPRYCADTIRTIRERLVAHDLGMAEATRDWEDFVVEYMKEEKLPNNKNFPSHVWIAMRRDSTGREIQNRINDIKQAVCLMIVDYDLPTHYIPSRLK